MAALAVCAGAIFLAVLRRRGVALPWWLDWIGALAAPIVALTVGLTAGRTMFGARRAPQDTAAAPAAGDATNPPLPVEPPTHDVQEIIYQSGKQLTEDPPDDIHSQLREVLRNEP